GNTIQDCTPEQFERHLNEHAPLKVLDGYAPFCKLHVHRNWTSTRCLTVPVTDANRHLLRSAYEARTREELPVLVRWFEGVAPPTGRGRAGSCQCWCAGSRAWRRRWPTTWSSSSTAASSWRRKARRSTPTGAWSAASTRRRRRKSRWRRSRCCAMRWAWRKAV